MDCIEPEVRLITNPIKECKNISSKFIGLERTTHRARKDFAIVEWPAVIQGDKIRIPWTLYTLGQPRPQAKDMRGDPSNDYRVTRTEDRDGVLINDNKDDDATRAKQHTASDKGQGDSGGSADATKDRKEHGQHKSKVYQGIPKGHENTQF